MKVKLFLLILLTNFYLPTFSLEQKEDTAVSSYFKLTTSNGLIVAVYDSQKEMIEYVFPHIFANYDSALFVKPFVGNIKLKTIERPIETSYLENTHVIQTAYKDFEVCYFASFTNDDKIFYIAAKGEKSKIEDLTFEAEFGDGKMLSGISLLTNSHDDLRVYLAGSLHTASVVRKQSENIYEKYFLFSFTDSLHTDSTNINKAFSSIKNSTSSLIDEEISYMKNLFAKCSIPVKVTPKERAVVEQSISFLKMAQVSDKEIFPNSRGQILASLRPGLWHVSWVRDGSYAIQALTKLGLFSEARKALEFMLKAPAGKYKNYIHTDGKDYGVGSDYQISVCRYFGNGNEESTFVGGPNIEFDNFGLFLTAYADYVAVSGDTEFHKKWNKLVSEKVADVTISCIDTNSLIRADSGPWEHYLQMPKQYTFTSGVCARGLQQYALIQNQFNLPYEKYEYASKKLTDGIFQNMLCENKFFKGNANDKLRTDYEYYDAGTFEIFANRLIKNKDLFLSHMGEYNKELTIKGNRPGYIRLSSFDPYENQEWVFINLRIASAHLLFDQKSEAEKLINFVTEQAALNYNTIPEMYSNKVQSDKVTEYFMTHDVWCNCIRDKDNLYIGAIPMIGYGSGAYILALFDYYKK